jgi:hypothetical protein
LKVPTGDQRIGPTITTAAATRNDGQCEAVGSQANRVAGEERD